MAAELLGAKMMAPYYGTSLFVWASVLGVTLGGLASGYFAGGYISEKNNPERNLHIILVASAVFLIIMPMLAKEVMLYSAGFELLISVLLSSVIFLFPPVFLLGMVSPVIIACITKADIVPKSGEAGKTAGLVFAISTVGGIISTFLLGFYIIPVYGLTRPAMILGITLGIIPFIILIREKTFFALLLPLAAFFAFAGLKNPVENPELKIHYASEGLLGQILVADYPIYEGMNKVDGSQRILFVNRSTQTIVTAQYGKRSFFEYVHLIEGLTADSVSRDKSALVLGLGGGSAANVFVKNGFRVSAVELDPRMVHVAEKYFELSEKTEVHVDDARHYLKRKLSNGMDRCRYDVILLDAFVGEVNPHHLFTREFFSEVRTVLKDSGSFFINGNGYWNAEDGMGMRAVCKTLVNSGFDVELIPAGESEDYRNLLFVAKKSNAAIGSVRSAAIIDLNLEQAVVLTDEKPQLEILNARANKKWREACMKYFLSGYYSGQDRLIFE